MPLIEALAIDLGASIAKSILKIWFKDSGIIDDTTSSLVDTIKSHISDKITQRRTIRQFEEIGEKVGMTLLPLFEIEGVTLEENNRIAIVRAVEETLDIAKSNILVQYDLEPSKLAKHLLTTRPPSVYHFSEVESLLYSRIVTESCKYIIDIASMLPEFTEQTFAEIFERLRKISEKIDLLIQEVQQEREQNSHLARNARFEFEYRDATKRVLDKLELFGANVRGDSREQSLSIAYIRLSIQQKVLGVSKLSLRRNSGSNIATELNTSTSANDTQIDKTEGGRSIVPADEALKGSRLLLICGGAGSGKTTLLQWIAVNAVKRSFQKSLQEWNSLLPFYIRLRHHVNLEQSTRSNLPRPEEFPNLISKAIDTPPIGWVAEKLRSGNAIVLIDGIDEVPEIQREDVRMWLEDLIESYPKARFIITSRPPAVDGDDWIRWIKVFGFRVALLQPMNLYEIFEFIDHWHEAVAKRLSDAQEKATLLIFAQTLKEDLQQNRSKRDLAKTPLLCAMLCALNRDRHRQLPSDRMELYEACCRLLVEQRDRARGILLKEYPAAALEYPQKLLLLQDLAYWMIRNSLSEAELKQVDERFKQRLNGIRNLPQNLYTEESGMEARRFFIERSSIIREPLIERIDFSHRSFQEFLTAQAVLKEGDIGVLVQNAHKDQWREVILLASSSMISVKMHESLIEGLIEQGEKQNEHSTSLYLLAAACLENFIEDPKPNLKARVEHKISNLLPLKNPSDAHELAVAGELAVPYLVTNDEHDPKIRAACIEALGYLGSEEALKALEGYVDDTHREVSDTLWQIWDFFDGNKRITYEQRVLAQLRRGPSDQSPLSIVRFTSLNAFEQFTKLTSLCLKDCEYITDLTPLASLSQLTTLSLMNCPRFSNLTSISSLPQLINLSLINFPQLSSLIPLNSLSQLKLLILSQCHRVRDFSPLSNLDSLKELHLDFHSRVPIPQNIIDRTFYLRET